MTSQQGLPVLPMRQREPEPDEQGELIVMTQPGEDPDDELDPDGQLGAECSSYIPRYVPT